MNPGKLQQLNSDRHDGTRPLPMLENRNAVQEEALRAAVLDGLAAGFLKDNLLKGRPFSIPSLGIEITHAAK
jgi:hypothetical protein